jgi:ribosome-binding ATPase YchF (GTP1/OBG family)
MQSIKQPLIGLPNSHLKIGIVGTANVGKSTLFNSFVRNELKFSQTQNCLFSSLDPNIAIFTPADPQIDYIASIYAARVMPCRVTVADTAGIVEGSFREGAGVGVSSLECLRSTDCYLHLLWQFEDETVQHYEGSLDLTRDLAVVY